MSNYEDSLRYLLVYKYNYFCGNVRSEVNISVFLNNLPPSFVRQDLSVNLELTSLSRLTGPQAPPVFTVPALELHMCVAIPFFLCGCWGCELS